MLSASQVCVAPTPRQPHYRYCPSIVETPGASFSCNGRSGLSTGVSGQGLWGGLLALDYLASSWEPLRPSPPLWVGDGTRGRDAARRRNDGWFGLVARSVGWGAVGPVVHLGIPKFGGTTVGLGHSSVLGTGSALASVGCRRCGRRGPSGFRLSPERRPGRRLGNGDSGSCARGVTLTPALSRRGRGCKNRGRGGLGAGERADTWVRPYVVADALSCGSGQPYVVEDCVCECVLVAEDVMR